MDWSIRNCYTWTMHAWLRLFLILINLDDSMQVKELWTPASLAFQILRHTSKKLPQSTICNNVYMYMYALAPSVCS